MEGDVMDADRERRGRVLRRSGFGLMAVVVALITLVNVGSAFEDPGGWPAVGIVARYLVPISVLGALAWFRPRWAVGVLGGLIGVIIAASVWFALAPEAWREFEDRNGPIRFIAMFILAGPIGLLGLKRTMAAGMMLLVLAVVPIVISSLGSRLGFLPMAVVGTLSLISGALYLASAARARRAPPPGAPETAPMHEAA